MVGKKKEKRNSKKTNKQKTQKTTTTTLLSEEKEEAGNVSEQRVKGWIHVIRVSTRYNPTEPTATRQGKRRSRTKTE